MDSIAILDFGSQYAQIIARRVREAQVYCELFPWDAPIEQILAIQPKGFILSGDPNLCTKKARRIFKISSSKQACLSLGFVTGCRPSLTPSAAKWTPPRSGSMDTPRSNL